MIPLSSTYINWPRLFAGTLALAAWTACAQTPNDGAGPPAEPTSGAGARSATSASSSGSGGSAGATGAGGSAEAAGGAAATGAGGSAGATGGTGSTGSAGASGSAGAGGSGVDGGGLGGVGAAQFKSGELDPPSNGGTITFQNIGKAGWFPSRRDPATGPCDFANTAGCCKTRFDITSDKLTPWDEDLIMTLRGPLLIKQLVAYQPNPADASQWLLTSVWDDRSQTNAKGVAFNGNKTETSGFDGVIGTECLVDASSDRLFACGPGSVPYCPPSTTKKYYGWQGSKMIVLLSAMPYADSGKIAAPCSQTNTGGWYNAPWVGFSHGELIRAGAFGGCQCYSATDPNAGDGCGQFNVFETVNDNNSFRNFDVFSTNFFGYAGYVGEGPCGVNCKSNLFPPLADLIDKTTSLEATQGAVSQPGKGVGAAFRRPLNGYRYFVILLDVDSRTAQLAVVHPQKIPPALGAFLPNLPSQIPRSAIDLALQTRLPK
jgi:hypothetical protein